MPSSIESLWLSRQVLARMSEEAEANSPNETGGVLLVYWSVDTHEPVVNHYVGPGPSALHESDSFSPDHEFQCSEIARIYIESGRRVSYLGDWHTHPGGAARLSKRDLSTLATIASAEEARASLPIMMILAPGPEWLPYAWVGVSNRKKWFERPKQFTLSINVRLFTPPN